MPRQTNYEYTSETSQPGRAGSPGRLECGMLFPCRIGDVHMFRVGRFSSRWVAGVERSTVGLPAGLVFVGSYLHRRVAQPVGWVAEQQEASPLGFRVV